MCDLVYVFSPSCYDYLLFEIGRAGEGNDWEKICNGLEWTFTCSITEDFPFLSTSPPTHYYRIGKQEICGYRSLNSLTNINSKKNPVMESQSTNVTPQRFTSCAEMAYLQDHQPFSVR